MFYVAGTIKNSKGELIPATVQLTWITPRTLLGTPTTTAGNYNAWVDENADQYGVTFSVAGYETKMVSILNLNRNPNVVLKEIGKSTASMNDAIIPLAAIALVYWAYTVYKKKQAKKGKQIGKLTTGDVMPIFLIIGGIMAFSVIRRILEALGLMDSADTRNLDDAANDPNAFWNPEMWRNIPPGQSYTSPFTLSRATELATTLYNAFGAFNDNEEQAINVFKQCQTQANASYICHAFQLKYGQDCLTFLRGGWWPQDRLSDKDVNRINDYVRSLKRY